MTLRFGPRLALAVLSIAVCLLAHATLTPALAQAKRLAMMQSVSCPSTENPQILRPLAAKGWVAGTNLVIDCVVAGNQLDRLPELAAELASRRPDIMLSGSSPMIRSLMAASSTIPIVMFAAQDPVRERFVASLRRPGGNVTGFTIAGIDLFGKRMQLLTELTGQPRRVAVIFRGGGDSGYVAALTDEANRTAQVLGFQWKAFETSVVGDFEPVFAQIAAEGHDAVYVVPGPLARLNARLVAGQALRNRLPAASDFEDFVDGGLLLSLGADTRRVFDIGADYVDRLLRGASPSELPVLQPTETRFAINAATAKALGLTVPPSILQRADKIVD